MIRFEFPLKTVSLLNMREHYRVAATRKALHRSTVRNVVRGRVPPPMPVTVTLTRVSAGVMDQHDNLPSCFKHIVDELAVWLGCDDADPRVTWRYAQQKCAPKKSNVIVEVS